MTPTQQERRIQALYDDKIMSRRKLCERVVHLEADMEELRELVQYILDECYGDDWFVEKANELGLKANY